MLLLYAVMVCFIKSTMSGITTTPGVQRKYYTGQTATFQWSVTGSISSYSVYNLQSGTLSANANYTLDSKKGEITLIIYNIRSTDAGNYSLSITIGATTQTDASALLFLYGNPTISVTQTYGGSPQQPAMEGDTVELTCTAISTSLPAAYRLKIYYQWYVRGIGTLHNVSSGPATLATYGDSVPGYSIKDDGKTLMIASAQYRDTQAIYCYGREQWSLYMNSYSFSLPLRYRPYITSRTPASKKFNAIVGDSVSLTFSFSAWPALTSATNWSFINTDGQVQDTPANLASPNTNSSFSLQFTFSSEIYYGTYSMTLNNAIGSTTETFQVLRPGPPDAQSNVKALAAPYLIVIAWNCGWFNGRQQTTYLQLKVLYNDSVVKSSNTILGLACYNSTYTTQFGNGTQPDTDYEVLVWSTNNLGSSDVIRLPVKTTKLIKFFVSPETISLNENQAIINFSATEAKIARLDVTCCLEATGSCYSNNYYNVNSTAGQITFDNMPSADVYIFDFRVNGGDTSIQVYTYLTTVKGVRVSRNEDYGEGPTTAPPVGERSNNLLTPVIVLAVLLGVGVLALIGCLIFILVSKRRQEPQFRNSHHTQQPRTMADTRTPQPTRQQNDQAYEEDNSYEAVDVNVAKSDTPYTALQGQRNS